MNDPTDTKTARYDIFCTLVRAKKPMTLSRIAKKMKIPRQNVAYHMPILEDSGLVIRDGDEYFCQPVFINDTVIEASVEKMTRSSVMLIPVSMPIPSPRMTRSRSPRTACRR